MKQLPLSRGYYATVNDADFDMLLKYKWHCKFDQKSPQLKYAYHVNNRNGNRYTISMHRLLLGLVKFDGKIVDHIDGDGLNNQRANLRICTHRENVRSQRPQRRKKTSAHKGVWWSTTRKRWIAQIRVDNKQIKLGQYKTEAEGIVAYDVAAKLCFGNFAWTNTRRG